MLLTGFAPVRNGKAPECLLQRIGKSNGGTVLPCCLDSAVRQEIDEAVGETDLGVLEFKDSLRTRRCLEPIRCAIADAGLNVCKGLAAPPTKADVLWGRSCLQRWRMFAKVRKRTLTPLQARDEIQCHPVPQFVHEDAPPAMAS